MLSPLTPHLLTLPENANLSYNWILNNDVRQWDTVHTDHIINYSNLCFQITQKKTFLFYIFWPCTFFLPVHKKNIMKQNTTTRTLVFIVLKFRFFYFCLKKILFCWILKNRPTNVLRMQVVYYIVYKWRF